MSPRRSDRHRWVPRLRAAALALLALAMLAGTPGTARADEYDAKYSGHPLRIFAYVVHPVGVALDYLIMRPAHWIGTREPFRTIFGHTDPFGDGSS